MIMTLLISVCALALLLGTGYQGYLLRCTRRSAAELAYDARNMRERLQQL